jgi:hypothetical protein
MKAMLSGICFTIVVIDLEAVKASAARSFING